MRLVADRLRGKSQKSPVCLCLSGNRMRQRAPITHTDNQQAFVF